MLLIVMHVHNLVKIHLFILKILSGNDILTSFKGHNSVTNWQKWTFNNPKLDVINIYAYAKFGQNPVPHSQDIERKQNSDVFQGPVMNWRKWTLKNPKLDVININAYAKFGQNPSKFSQDTVGKQKCYGWTDGLTTWKQYTPPILRMRGKDKKDRPLSKAWGRNAHWALMS